jgi:hypothetical protein
VPDEHRSNHETVLVVDDEDMILQLTRRMLERNDYRVLTASGGSSTLSVIGENPESVDLVLLDMTMPGMTGDQVLWGLAVDVSLGEGDRPSGVEQQGGEHERIDQLDARIRDEPLDGCTQQSPERR